MGMVMSKPSLGIFGDSFASLYCRNHKRYSGHPIMENLGKPWPLLLEDFNVSVHAQTGSDLYFSYKLFQENKHKYDKNIFVITALHRLTVRNHLTGENIHLHHYSIAKSKKDRSTGHEKDIMDAVLKYYKYIIDYEKDLLYYNLIVKEMEKEDVLLINGFGENGLIKVFDMESNVWGLKLTFQKGEKFKDFRYCHLTKENNIILAEIINDCLKNNKPFIFDIDKFYKPAKNEKHKYVIETKIIERWKNGKSI